ncbi:MAG: hypothetical protein IIB59_01560 [Planctomycetes bacterium]|nr:hypothetical protein [Planctomycetota bacterium]
MSKRAQHLCLMLASQVGCVAVGLWMQRQFLQSAAFSAAVDQAWIELDAEIGPVALSIDDPAISAEAPRLRTGTTFRALARTQLEDGWPRRRRRTMACGCNVA